MAAAGQPRHGDAQTQDTLQTQDKRGGPRGRGQGSGRRGAPKALDLSRRPGRARQPSKGTSRRGRRVRPAPHLPPLRVRHRGRQEKACLTRASSGNGRWASRAARGTRRCRVPSDAEECGAGEAAGVDGLCRQRLLSGSSARTSSSSRKGISPKRSTSCRRSWGEAGAETETSGGGGSASDPHSVLPVRASGASLSPSPSRASSAFLPSFHSPHGPPAPL